MPAFAVPSRGRAELVTTTARPPLPQPIIFSVLGRYCMDDNPPLPTSLYLDVLARVGITVTAARLTLNRMVDRGFLQRSRLGRITNWSASDLGIEIVRRQQLGTFGAAQQPPGPEGAWTILCFSIPETRRGDRHMLRRRLEWEGFGLLRDGVWIAAGDRDVEAILESEVFDEVRHLVEGFVASPKFVDVKTMVARAWSLDTLRNSYEQFLDEWGCRDPAPSAVDALGRDLMLITSWRQLLREAPSLPLGYLPPDWPAERCDKLFQRRHAEYGPTADKLFQEIKEAHS